MAEKPGRSNKDIRIGVSRTMKKNKIRVVCNPIAKHISFYYKNELNEWVIFSGSSPLSRNYYTNTTLEERGKEIVVKLDEIYNRKNKGLDISFEGDEKGFQLIARAIEETLSDRNISCHMGSTKVIVVGKKGVGKTFLIEAMEELQGMEYKVEKHDTYTLYTDNNNTEWYEINGIDFGQKNVKKASSDIETLVKDKSAMIVYCIHSSNRRIEEAESKFIMTLIHKFPELAGMIVLTQTVNKQGLLEFVDEIEKITDQIKVVPVLAKDFELDMENEKTEEPIVIRSFGLDKLASYVFEGR